MNQQRGMYVTVGRINAGALGLEGDPDRTLEPDEVFEQSRVTGDRLVETGRAQHASLALDELHTSVEEIQRRMRKAAERYAELRSGVGTQSPGPDTFRYGKVQYPEDEHLRRRELDALARQLRYDWAALRHEQNRMRKIGPPQWGWLSAVEIKKRLDVYSGVHDVAETMEWSVPPPVPVAPPDEQGEEQELVKVLDQLNLSSDIGRNLARAALRERAPEVRVSDQRLSAALRTRKQRQVAR